jgi:hypothetical protein
MDIEPLKTILSLSSSKQQTLFDYLSKDLQNQLINSTYTEDKYYLNDTIFCIRKDNLQLEIKGKIFQIDNDTLGIQLSSTRNQYIDKKNYYTFVKTKQSTLSQRKLMEQLLKQL